MGLYWVVFGSLNVSIISLQYKTVKDFISQDQQNKMSTAGSWHM